MLWRNSLRFVSSYYFDVDVVKEKILEVMNDSLLVLIGIVILMGSLGLR